MHVYKIIPAVSNPVDFRRFFDAIPTASLILSPEMEVLAASETYLQVTETKRSELIGRRLDRDFGQDPTKPWICDVRRLTSSVQRVLRTGHSHHFLLRRRELDANFADRALGRRTWCVNNTPILDSAGKLIWVWHRLEDFGTGSRPRIGRLKRRLIAIQEADRARIARELHDQMAQYVSAMMLGLESLKQPMNAARFDHGVERLQDLVQQVGHDIHRLTWDLRPAPIEELGFRRSLEHCVEELSARGTTELHFHSNLAEGDRFDPGIETICYRTVQEGLANIIQHSQAQAASVIVTHSDDQIQIIIEDDGVGFDRGDSSEVGHAHLGLVGMRERLSLIGGSLQIETSPGRGTSLFIRLPVHGRKKRL